MKARNRLHEYISTCRPDERAQCVRRIGWHGDAFVLPDETIGDTGDERVLLQKESHLNHAFNIEGTLADWQEHVAQYAAPGTLVSCWQSRQRLPDRFST